MPDLDLEVSMDTAEYNVGDTATITCTASLNSSIAEAMDEDITVTMTINGVGIEPYPDPSQLPANGSFFLRRLTVYSAREYTCEVYVFGNSPYIYPCFESATDSLYVKCKLHIHTRTCMCTCTYQECIHVFKCFCIAPDPVIILSAVEPSYRVGDHVVLSCSYSSFNVHPDSTALLVWRRDRTVLQSETASPIMIIDNYFKFLYSSIYKALNIRLSDAGRYSCQVQIVSTEDTPFLLSSNLQERQNDVMIVSKFT